MRLGCSLKRDFTTASSLPGARCQSDVGVNVEPKIHAPNCSRLSAPGEGAVCSSWVLREATKHEATLARSFALLLPLAAAGTRSSTRDSNTNTSSQRHWPVAKLILNRYR